MSERLEIKDLHVAVEGSEILKGVNLTIGRGEVHALMGMTACMDFLERLKELGFHHATEGGISIGIDDIIIPPEKSNIINTAQKVVDGYVRDHRDGALPRS